MYLENIVDWIKLALHEVLPATVARFIKGGEYLDQLSHCQLVMHHGVK
jgi:hypothetical protein